MGDKHTFDLSKILGEKEISVGKPKNPFYPGILLEKVKRKIGTLVPLMYLLKMGVDVSTLG
jgi:hypothetical protein